MATAREIIDERLAKGEIDEETYDRLMTRLMNKDQIEAKAAKPPPLQNDTPPVISDQVPAPPPLPINRDSNHRDSANNSSNNEEQKKPKLARVNWIFVIVGIVVCSFIIGIIANLNILSIGNIKLHDGKVNFRLANSSWLDGDIVIWIEQDNIEFCEYVTNIKSDMVYDMSISCSQIREGKYSVNANWVESEPGKARVATRF